MSMTRKDYRVVADALRATRPDQEEYPGRYHQWRVDRDLLCIELRHTNRNFKPDKFVDWTEK